MTNVYLEKIASQKKEESNFHPGEALGAAVVGSVAATPLQMGAMKLGAGFKESMNDTSTSGSSLSTVKKYMKDTGLNKTHTFNYRGRVLEQKGYSPMSRNVAEHLHATGNPAFYPDGKNKGIIGGVRQAKDDGFFSLARGKKAISPDVIMHELGHAEDFSKHRALKQIGMRISRGPGAAIAGLASLGALSHDSTRDYAVPLSAAPIALMMREEMTANHNAYKAIKKFDGHEAAKKFLKGTASKNMANYGLAGAAAVGSTYVAKKLLDKYVPRKMEKTAGVLPAQTSAGKEGLQYLLHNVAVPGATIFAADLGAHAAAEKMLNKDELKKLASALKELV